MAEVIVLGAGMVGLSSALALRDRGHAVTVIDRRAAGRETSYGNAGIIQGEAVEPYFLPRDLRTLIRYALGRSNEVTWSLRGLASMAPALAAYYRQSAPRRHARISQVYAQLIQAATEDHAPLIAASGAGNLITRDGYCEIFRTEAELDRATAGLARMERQYGLAPRVLDAAAMAAEEPALTAPVGGAIHWPQAWTCADPGQLTAQYATLFERRGGRVLTGDAGTLRQDGVGWTADTADGRVAASDVVVALGPWAPILLKRFGYRIRMVLKRGYHGHFAAPRALRRPLVDGRNGVVAASMRQGLRIATGAAIVPQDAPADLRQLTRGAAHLGDFLDVGPRIEGTQWHGARPCMPGMLPLVGAAPRHRGMWFNFGHGHQGFTLGPTTARILAAALDGDRGDLARALRPGGI